MNRSRCVGSIHADKPNDYGFFAQFTLDAIRSVPVAIDDAGDRGQICMLSMKNVQTLVALICGMFGHAKLVKEWNIPTSVTADSSFSFHTLELNTLEQPIDEDDSRTLEAISQFFKKFHSVHKYGTLMTLYTSSTSSNPSPSCVSCYYAYMLSFLFSFSLRIFCFA
jgi:hypothetical protein